MGCEGSYTDDWNIKEVELNTDEGTWMNLDVNPYGSQILFDLLGDIYIMPISGGNAMARSLRGGLEVQPTWQSIDLSPNTKNIRRSLLELLQGL